MVEEIKEKIDYGWLVVKQLDRVLEAFSNIDPIAARPGIRRAALALRALIAIVKPVIKDNRDKLVQEVDKAYSVMDRDVRDAWEGLLKVLEELVSELYDKELLLRIERLPVGWSSPVDEV